MTKPPDIPIVLSTEEMRIAKTFGAERQRRNDAASVRDGRRHDAMTSVDVHVMGLAGEIAFCKLTNVYPDFTTEPRRGTPDCQYFGQTVDIKTSKSPNANLVVPVRSRALATNWYALMVVAWPSHCFRFCGLAHVVDIERPDRLTDLGKGPVYLVPRGELLTADEIFRTNGRDHD